MLCSPIYIARGVHTCACGAIWSAANLVNICHMMWLTYDNKDTDFTLSTVDHSYRKWPYAGILARFDRNNSAGPASTPAALRSHLLCGQCSSTYCTYTCSLRTTYHFQLTYILSFVWFITLRSWWYCKFSKLTTINDTCPTKPWPSTRIVHLAVTVCSTESVLCCESQVVNHNVWCPSC